MNKKDVLEVAEVIIIALCCPLAIFFPPFNNLIQEEKEKKGKSVPVVGED